MSVHTISGGILKKAEFFADIAVLASIGYAEMAKHLH